MKVSLASLPEGDAYTDVRASITQRIDTLRKQASKAKPVGAQLDACKAAINRARKRTEEAEELIALMQAVRDEAAEETSRLCKELVEIQSRVPQEADVDKSDSSIDAMNKALATVLGEMKTGGVAPAVVGEAEALMAKLSAGIERVAELAREAARTQNMGDIQQSVGDPPAEPPVKVRLLNKTSEKDYVSKGFTVATSATPTG